MPKEKIDISKLQLKKKIDTTKYYDIHKVLSYNAFFNVSMGGRGIGKTTQLKIWGVEHFKKTGKQFIYLRRYKSETSLLKNFLDDICDDVKFVGDKNDGGSFVWNGYTIGYLKALSIAQNYKSNNFDDVDLIIYDEAIIRQSLSQRYLKNEVELLFEFISTVFRNRFGCRVFILGNNLDFFNPYCEYFRVKVFNKMYYDKNKSLYIEYCDIQPALKEIETTTPLFKLTQGTAYNKYHYENEVLTNEMVDNTPKRQTDKCIFRIILNDYTLNFYSRDNQRILIESKNKIIKDDLSMVILENGNDINWYYFNYFKTKYLKYMLYMYYDKQCDFADNNAQALMTMFIDIF